MESATRSARNILTGLHEVMASKNHAQGKLNHVVNIIGEALSSEVCSIYLLRDGALELFATRGLNQAAVHITRLGLGEGLVGTIAENVETLNLDEAAAHPNFRYVPETGVRWACSRFNMSSRANMRKSKLRRCRPSQWSCLS
jgi:phosphotransferase system enzyme I (PtsP)